MPSRTGVAAANARDWRAQNDVFEDIALVRAVPGNVNLTGQGDPERLQVALISANLLSVLRVSPMLGRGFTEAEDDIGGDAVVILSFALWQSRFGGDRDVVGRTVVLSGSRMTIVGVMGPDFQYPSRDFQIWRPLTINPADYPTRAPFSLLAIARLKPDVSLAAARAAMEVIARRLEQQYPDKNKDLGVLVEPLLDDTVAAVKRPLYVLLAAVGAMLLIASANLANLILTRALSRRRSSPFAPRLAPDERVSWRNPLRSSRRPSSSAACWVCSWPVGPSIFSCRGCLPTCRGSKASRFTCRSCSSAPLCSQSSASSPAHGPPSCSRRPPGSASVGDLTRATTAAPSRAHVRDLLVVAQVAMTLLLLVTATLLIRSFAAISNVDPGFQSKHVLSLHVAIPRAKYRSDSAVADFCRQVLERIASLPEVESAGMVNRLPFGGGTEIGRVQFEGVNDTTYQTDWRSVTPGYFRTLAIPLVRGRWFTDADTEQSPKVGVIDERLAHAVWGDANPIGRRFRMAVDKSPWMTSRGRCRTHPPRHASKPTICARRCTGTICSAQWIAWRWSSRRLAIRRH